MQAVRDVRDVHGAWKHVVSEEERARYLAPSPAPPHVDASVPGLAWAWVSSRLFFMALMLVLMLVVHAWLFTSHGTRGTMGGVFGGLSKVWHGIAEEAGAGAGGAAEGSLGPDQGPADYSSWAGSIPWLEQAQQQQEL